MKKSRNASMPSRYSDNGITSYFQANNKTACRDKPASDNWPNPSSSIISKTEPESRPTPTHLSSNCFVGAPKMETNLIDHILPTHLLNVDKGFESEIIVAKPTKKENNHKQKIINIKRVFQESWLESFPWLRYDKSKKIMTCIICTEANNVTEWRTGITLLKKDCCVRHAGSNTHKKSVKAKNMRKGNEIQNEDISNFAYKNKTANDNLPSNKTSFEDSSEKANFVMPAYFNHKQEKHSTAQDSPDPIEQNDMEKTKEFDIFGNGVAAQLNNLPFVNALELQLKIQHLITRYRMALQNQSGSSTLQVHSTEIMNSVNQNQNGVTQEYESTNAILSNQFDEQIFGDYVVASIHKLQSNENKSKLKQKIKKCIIEMSDVNKSISATTQLKMTTETPESEITCNLSDGIGTSNFALENSIKEEPIEVETEILVDPLTEDLDTLTPAFKKRKTDNKTDYNLEDTLNMISGNYLSDSKKAREFELFGSGIAAQLNNMPFINAIELQSQIQQLISQYRLNYAHCKIKQLQT